jgi:hypothetical protein
VYEVDPIGKIAVVPNEQAQVIKAAVPVLTKPTPLHTPPLIVVSKTIISTTEPVSVLQPITSINAGTSISLSIGSPITTMPSAQVNTAILAANASEAPLNPGCSSQMNNKERITCFNQQISKIVLNDFDTNIARELSIN